MKSIIIAVILGLFFFASPALADYQYGLDAFNKGEYKSAYTRWRKAAMAGDKYAQYQLARLYQTGLGAPKSPKLAYIWFTISAHSGIAGADESGEIMKKLLTSGDLDEADWTIQEFIKAHSVDTDTVTIRPEASAEPHEDSQSADRVRDVQEMLARIGYRPGPPDGKPGRRTELAIREFQKLKGLPPNGEVSDQLYATLEQVVPPATTETLFDAARTGNPTAVIAILRQGVDIQSQDSDGLTALHHACANGHPMTTGILLDAGADIKTRTKSGKTPLDMARPTENSELIQLLIKRGGQ